MTFHKTDLDDLYLVKSPVYRDGRGYFLETFREEYFSEGGMKGRFLQDNYSFSVRGVVRGLHYQIGKAAQQKLVSVTYGEILDVAVDLRRDSPTFGKAYSAILNSENHHMLWIPEGFAHGFSVLSPRAGVSYKCSAYYDPEQERGIRWDDPELEIDWRVDDPIVSEKDRNQPVLSELKREDLF